MSLIYGRNPVREALRGRRAEAIGEIWASERLAREPWLCGRDLRIVPPAEIAKRCGSSAHQGVCAEAGEYPYADAAQLLAVEEPLIVVLDHVEDPHNLGSICRTAECVGATGVAIHERGSASVTSAVCRASAGAVEHVALARVRNVADFLRDTKAAGSWCYGAVAPGDGERRREVLPYDALDYRGGVALVLGSEGSGVRRRVLSECDELIALPLRGRVKSLGVSAAAAALLYGILRSREKAA